MEEERRMIWTLLPTNTGLEDMWFFTATKDSWCGLLDYDADSTYRVKMVAARLY